MHRTDTVHNRAFITRITCTHLHYNILLLHQGRCPKAGCTKIRYNGQPTRPPGLLSRPAHCTHTHRRALTFTFIYHPISITSRARVGPDCAARARYTATNVRALSHPPLARSARVPTPSRCPAFTLNIFYMCFTMLQVPCNASNCATRSRQRPQRQRAHSSSHGAKPRWTSGDQPRIPPPPKA